jgi:phospholipid/cholesterol/gamma-HCH transport system ATP-binding protein
MFGPREMLLSSDEPVVRQFLNAQTVGPIGMSEEKDADELAAEAKSGQELPPLPPIPLQLGTTDGTPRRGERPAGEWCRANGITPPPGSFQSHNAGMPAGRRTDDTQTDDTQAAEAAV